MAGNRSVTQFRAMWRGLDDEDAIIEPAELKQIMKEA